jgi:hypothetical protein
MEFPSHESNFDFLADREPKLAELGREAEMLASLNPNTCIMQVRLIAELLAKNAAGQLQIYETDNLTFFQTLQRLEELPEFGDNIQAVFHNIRRDANGVVHGEQFVDAKSVARHYLKLARKAAIWYQQTFVDPSFSPDPFEPPPDYEDRYTEVLEERRDLRDRIQQTRETIEEVRRRENVIRIFPNDESAWRLLGAYLAERHEEWSTKRKYLTMEEYQEWKCACEGGDNHQLKAAE